MTRRQAATRGKSWLKKASGNGNKTNPPQDIESHQRRKTQHLGPVTEETRTKNFVRLLKTRPYRGPRLQPHLDLRDRRKGSAMVNAWPVQAERRDMFGGAVTGITLPPITGMG